MKTGQSIWTHEFHLPAWVRLPAGIAEWFAFVCAGSFIISPFLFGIPCLIHHSIDYTIYTHPVFIQIWIWPLSAVTGLMALGITCVQMYGKWNRLFRWLRRNPVVVCFGFTLIWMLVSTCVNGWDVYTSVEDKTYLRFETVFMQFGYFLILFPAALLLRDRRKKESLIRLHEAVSLFLALAAFVLWRTQIDSTFFRWKPRVTAIYSNINYYGYYLSVSIPLSAAMFVAERRPCWKAFSMIVMATNTAALSLNNTMGAWVACAMSMVFLLVAHGVLEHGINRQVLLAALVFAICLYLPGHLQGSFEENFFIFGSDLFKILTQAEDADEAGSHRWIIWKNGLKLIADSPVFGIGFEGVYVRGLRDIAYNTRIHNEYLQYALFYGIPAGIAYLFGCIGVFIRAVKRRLSMDPITLVCLTAAFGYLVSAFFGLTLFCTTPFLFVFLGMGYLQEDNATPSSTE